VRILAATSRDLEEAVAQAPFAAIFTYFRLNVLSLKIAPLRGRRQDIPLLTGTSWKGSHPLEDTSGR
jgi:transcriptional regulator with GAF, ATPase, and Fis domain